MVGGEWAHCNVGLLVAPNFGTRRWLQTNGCPHLYLRGHTVSISQTPVPMRTTLLLQHLGEAVVVGLDVEEAGDAFTFKKVNRISCSF